MNVKNIAAVIDEIFPLRLAQDWDNVGLLVGDWRKSVRNVLLTIDTTSDVVAEAKKLKTDLIRRPGRLRGRQFSYPLQLKRFRQIGR